MTAESMSSGRDFSFSSVLYYERAKESEEQATRQKHFSDADAHSLIFESWCLFLNVEFYLIS